MFRFKSIQPDQLLKWKFRSLFTLYDSPSPWVKYSCLSQGINLYPKALSYHPCFPSTMCWATSSGNFTPRISSSVTVFMASTQASNGDKQTYHPAQKKPTGQARNHRQRNQMIAHKTFIVPDAKYFSYRRKIRPSVQWPTPFNVLHI